MLFFSVYGCMLCLVRYLFVISTSVIDCLGRFVPEMTYYVSSGMLYLARLNSPQFMSLNYLLYSYHAVKLCCAGVQSRRGSVHSVSLPMPTSPMSKTQNGQYVTQ